MAKKDFRTKDEFFKDLQLVLYTVISKLGSLYKGIPSMGKENFGLCLADDSGFILENFAGDPQTRASYLPIRSMPFGFSMELAYDYAVNGVMYRRMGWGEGLYLSSSQIDLFMDFKSSSIFKGMSSDEFPIDSCARVIEVGLAREIIDGFRIDQSVLQGHIHIKDVALLANIDEKTARNLANPKTKNHLETINWQGRTLVSIAFAKEWLKNRGFKETVIQDHRFNATSYENGFTSTDGLVHYVLMMMGEEYLSEEDAAKLPDTDDGFQEWLKEFINFRPILNEKYLLALGKFLNIDDKGFAVAAAKTIYRDLMRRMVGYTEKDINF